MPLFTVFTDQTAATQVFNSSLALEKGNVNDCVILGANVTVPWDNPHNLISLQTSMMIENVKTLLFVIGLTTNVLNAMVFARQGLSERINMCLFTLSLTDLACVSCMMAMNGDAIYMKVTRADSPTAYLDYRPAFSYFVNNNLLGLYGLFSASSFLNVVISTERCVCVLFPFRAKKCVPTKALAAVLVTLIFVVTKQYVYQCFYEVVTDRVTWHIGVGEYFFKHRAMLETISIFYGFGLTVACPVVVCVTTLITSVKLYRVITWRKTTSSLSSSSASSVSVKEVAVTKMLICVSTEFVAFSMLGVLVIVAPFLQPRLSPGACMPTFSVSWPAGPTSASWQVLLSIFSSIILLGLVTGTLSSRFFAGNSRRRKNKRRQMQPDVESMKPQNCQCSTSLTVNVWALNFSLLLI
jgi:hypothetical protein